MFGYSRDAYYKAAKREAEKGTKKEEVIKLVQRIRKKLPKIGTRKLHHLLKDELRGRSIKVGRDKIFDILRESNLLVKKKKRYVQTTNSKHWLRKYPNRAKEVKINRPEELWVSDITYVSTDDGFCYLTMITDAYSRKVMGYDVSNNLTNEGTINALNMAIKNREYRGKLLHHSDRGLQYCSKEYVELLNKNEIEISMTEKSDPYENALAERMNRTIKEEFLLVEKFKNIDIARATINESVKLYNKIRPHLSCGMLTPEEMHKKQLTSVGLRPPEVNLNNHFNN